MRTAIIALAALCMASCAKRQPTLADAIPQDARMVVTVVASDTAYAFQWRSWYGAVMPTDMAQSLQWLTPFAGSFVTVADDSRTVVLGPCTLMERDDQKARAQALLRQSEGGQPHFSGSDLIDLLRATPTTRTTLLAVNMVMDADMVLGSIDGQLILDLTDGARLRAQVTDTSFMGNVADWTDDITECAGVTFDQQGDSAFTCHWQDLEFGMAVSGGWLTIDLPAVDLSELIPLLR